MKEEKKLSDVLTKLEQFETEAANIAVITATYYKELIENQVPPSLAEKLTLDVHNLWWTKLVARGK